MWAAILVGCTEDDTVDVEPTAAFTADDPTGVAAPYPTDDFQVNDTAAVACLWMDQIYNPAQAVPGLALS